MRHSCAWACADGAFAASSASSLARKTSMSTESPAISPPPPPTLLGSIADSIADWGGAVIDSIQAIGDMSLFSVRVSYWLSTRLPKRETLLPNFYQVGV